MMYSPVDSQWPTRNFLEMNCSRIVVVGNKDDAKFGNGDLCFGKRTASSLCPGGGRLDVMSFED